MRVALLAAGDIADQYVAGMAQFPELELVAITDSDEQVSARRASQWSIDRLSWSELLGDQSVELVVNLTPPRAHLSTTTELLEAGKHVYLEKPLALEVAEGRRLVELAAERRLGLACAPDTFLGSAWETARDAVLGGAVGTPLAATAFVGNPGPEYWHPAPEAYYDTGAGPLFSLGPYYLTILVQLMGPIAEASAFSATPRETRARPNGSRFPVNIATTYAGALRFASGAVATIFASYDVAAERMVPIELYGTEHSLSLPDPNLFDGRVLLSRTNGEWSELPVTHEVGRGRGIGVADLARSIRAGTKPRASAKLALHVLDAMCALDEGGRSLTTSL